MRTCTIVLIASAVAFFATIEADATVMVGSQIQISRLGNQSISPLPGDANLDGITDLSDFNIWNANKFSQGTGWGTADFNGDGNTDLSDFNIWNAHKFKFNNTAHENEQLVVTNLSRPGDQDFRTFCVEVQGQFNVGSTYTVDAIGTSVLPTGVVLGEFTAWLYTGFLAGTLADFNGDDTADVGAVQLAIWQDMQATEDEIIEATGQSWYDSRSDRLDEKQWATEYAQSGWTGIGKARIISLRSDDGLPAQDMLVAVPEPASIVIWLMLAAIPALAVWRRRRAGA